MTNLDTILKSRDITLPTKVHLVKATVFSSSHVWMWELDHKEGWAPKNWCFWTVVLEKTLESPLDCKEIKPVNPKGSQPWRLIGRTDAEAKAPIKYWPPDAKNWHWKRPWCWERLKAGREGDDRGRDGWMASLTRWTWVWANSGSWWCHPTISFSVTSFSSCPQCFPASGSFPVSRLFTSGGQSFGASASASVLPMNIQGWFPLGLDGLI